MIRNCPECHAKNALPTEGNPKSFGVPKCANCGSELFPSIEPETEEYSEITDKDKVKKPSTKLNIHVITLALCCLAIAGSIMSEQNSFMKAYKMENAAVGLTCIFLSFLCWKISQYFDKKNGLLEWCFIALSIFVFFPCSAIFFQHVSSLVSLTIMGYIVFYTFQAAGGGSWDGRGPDEGGD